MLNHEISFNKLKIIDNNILSEEERIHAIQQRIHKYSPQKEEDDKTHTIMRPQTPPRPLPLPSQKELFPSHLYSTNNAQSIESPKFISSYIKDKILDDFDFEKKEGNSNRDLSLDKINSKFKDHDNCLRKIIKSSRPLSCPAKARKSYVTIGIEELKYKILVIRLI